MEWVIYLLKDTNNKYYVGKSGGIKSRIRTHRHTIKNNKGSCSSRGLTIPFECEIVERFNNEAEMNTAEQRHYDLLKAQHGENLLNKERPLNTASQYIEQHRAELKETRRDYYEQHRAELKENARNYRENNREEINARRRENYRLARF